MGFFMALKTQGSQLFIIDEEASGGPEILTVECTTSMDGLGAPREQIETTCLESDAREYVGGLTTPGQITVTLNFDPQNESHFRLYEMWKANDNLKMAIGLSTPLTPPTLDTAGDFEFPTTRNYVYFEGYVVDLPINVSLNAVVTATVPIQVSGEYILFRKTA